MRAIKVVSILILHGLDAIYKSFSVDDIEAAVNAVRSLNFSGFAVSMPYKKSVINYLDELSPEAKEIGSVNTVLNLRGSLIGYNTDYLAAAQLLKENKETAYEVVILGAGGYASAVKYAASTTNLFYRTIVRDNWEQIEGLKEQLVFNCTPVKNIKLDETNTFIDCGIETDTGKRLGLIQASHQFELYTGLEFPIDFFNRKECD